MSIKYAILGLLNYSDMHGYRIKEHIEKNFSHMWSINFGQIYPSLKELKDEGLVRMLGVTPSDLVAILESLKQAGALNAEMVVI